MRGRGERERGTAEDSKARLFINKGWGAQGLDALSRDLRF
jgi:hypothetical protein